MTTATRRLVLAWAAMSGLTLAAVLFGHAGSSVPLGALTMGALLIVTGVKTGVLAHHYLDLRHGPGWNSALRIAIGLLLAVLFGLSLIAGIR